MKKLLPNSRIQIFYATSSIPKKTELQILKVQGEVQVKTSSAVEYKLPNSRIQQKYKNPRYYFCQ